MTEREKEFELEEKNFKIISSSFIYNYFLDMDRKYSPDYYLTSIMRFSILEKILSEYFFKFSKKKRLSDISLIRFLFRKSFKKIIIYIIFKIFYRYFRRTKSAIFLF